MSAQTTVTSTFTDKNWSVGTGEPKWTGSVSASQLEKDRGVQFGKNQGTVTLTSTEEHSNVTKVTIVASANGTAGKLSVTVGGTTVGSTLTIKKGTDYKNKEYTFENASPISGTIIVTASEGDHTIWIKSISITTQGSSSGEGGSAVDQEQEQKLVFANDSKEVYSNEKGNKFTNALTGAIGAVTYTSSAEAVATVDANGEVTIKGVGTATITATAAAATDEGTKYKETFKSYTLHVWPTSIAELKSITTNSEAAFKAKLTGAYITYVPDASNAYLQDASGAILIYKSGHGLKAGNCYTGEISGSTKKYYGLNEITAFDFSKATQTTKSDIVPEEVSLAELSTSFAHYESKYIKVTEVTAGSAVKNKGDLSKLTQGGTAYSSPELRAAAKLTDGITAETTYPAIIVFPSYYDKTEQLNLWSDDLVTLPAGTLKTPDVAFGDAAYEVAINKSIKLPFTTDSDGDVTYTATPSEDITLTKTTNGVSVTATATGTFTITANVAETANFAAGSTSTTLTVTPPASNLQNVVLYKKVTSTDEIVDGSVYLIVNEENKTALGTNSGDYCDKVSISFTETKTVEGLSAVNEAGSPYEVTFSKSEDGKFYLRTAYGYLYRPQADKNYVRATTDKSTATTWECTISNGDATLYSQNGTFEGYLRYNSTYPRFSCYGKATSEKAIQLYQKVGELKAHGVMGGYASYAADFAYIMPEGLMGKIVYLDGNKLTTENIYAGNTEVPALTPLLIRTYEAFSGTDEVKTYYPVVLDKEVAKNNATDKNALEYRRDIVDGKYKTSSLNFAEGCRYYKLSVDNEGLNPGFYYGAADGAAFEMKNGSSAYLTVAATNASPALLFEDNEITGIEILNPAQGTENNGAVYNLQGVRMNGKNLQKGLYIMNGKKVIIK